MKISAFALILALASAPAFAAEVCPNLAGTYSCANGAIGIVIAQQMVLGAWNYQVTEYSSATPGVPTDQKVLVANGRPIPLSSTLLGVGSMASVCQKGVLMTRLTASAMPYSTQILYYQDEKGRLIQQDGFILNGRFQTSEEHKLYCTRTALR